MTESKFPMVRTQAIAWQSDEGRPILLEKDFNEPTAIVVTDGQTYQFLIAESFDDAFGNRRCMVYTYPDDPANKVMGFKYWSSLYIRIAPPTIFTSNG